MRALVTGGAGFIGSNLVKELSKEHEVIIIDDLSSGRLENISSLLGDKVRLVKGSITDLPLIKKAMKDVDYVFHHAAIASVIRSIESPIEVNEVNAVGTLNILTAARDCGVKKVVLASSSAIYGDSPELPKKEDMTPRPISPYGVTKVTGEYYCRVFYEIYGLESISMRYFNIFGPNQDPSSQYAAVIPKFITSILNNKPPTIFGDGEQSRDFIYVKDVVAANLLAIKSTRSCEVINIGSGKTTTLNNLVKMINQITGKDIKSVYAEPKEGDIRNSVADISLGKKAIGFIPRYSLEHALKETIDWYKRKQKIKSELS